MNPQVLSKIKTGFNCLFASVFLLMLSLPLLEQSFHFAPEYEMVPNRYIREKPEFAWDKLLTTWPDDYEGYYTDNFGLRNHLVRWNSIVKVVWLHIPISERILIGRDKKTLFFNGSEGSTISDYRGSNLYTEEDLELIVKKFRELKAWYDLQGIKYAVCIVPNKATIYPERVPRRYVKVSQTTRMDQFINALRENTDILVIDVRPMLLEAKESRELYYHNDTHWNDYGAFIAYEEMMKQLSTLIPGLEPLPKSNFLFTKQKAKQEDLLRYMNLSGTETESVYTASPLFKPKWQPVNPPLGLYEHPEDFYAWSALNDDQSLPKALFIRDSFTTALGQFLVNHFSELHLSPLQIPEHIRNEVRATKELKPDLVVYQLVERYLGGMCVENPVEIQRAVKEAENGVAGEAEGDAADDAVENVMDETE